MKLKKIADIAKAKGATAKISSIHVNCWFGEHSKLATSTLLLSECFGIDNDGIQDASIFIGDSPNDETMFGYFKHSVGVANILESSAFEFKRPAFVTKAKGGSGFAEVANHLLRSRKPSEAEEAVR